MSNEYFLMYKDTAVVGFNQRFDRVNLLNEKFIPYGLKQDCSAISLYRWISQRATPISRKNVDFMYMLLQLPRSESGRTDIIQQYGGVSINDCFWIKRKDDTHTWGQMSPLYGTMAWSANDRAFGYRMLSGTGEGIRPERFSPETTIQGNWSKCLVKKSDGIYLYKANDEDMREVEVSNFGASLGLDIVQYWQEDYEDISCTVCKILSDEQNQWFFAEQVGIDTVANLFPEAYSTMQTFDYIVGNPDRHSLNWGLITDDCLNPISLTPLFDFNFALQNVAMSLPIKADGKLIRNAKQFLTTNDNIPNRAYYISRIQLLDDWIESFKLS